MSIHSHLTHAHTDTPQDVIEGLLEIQDGGAAPEDLNQWEDDPGRDELNLLDDVGLNYEQLLSLVTKMAPKP
jgi:hypothetical protein